MAEKSNRPKGVFAQPLCLDCVHLDLKSVNNCKAFPKGIPHEIWGLGFNHKKPFPGDNGIQFEEKK